MVLSNDVMLAGAPGARSFNISESNHAGPAETRAVANPLRPSRNKKGRLFPAALPLCLEVPQFLYEQEPELG